MKLSKKSKNTITATAVITVTFLLIVLFLFLLTQNGLKFFAREDRDTKFKISAVEGKRGANSDSVTVPNFIGQNIETIINNPDVANIFNFEFIEVYDEVEAGIIIDQDIQTNAKVEKDTIIKLTMSKGIEMIKFPDIINQEQKKVESRLLEEGFKVTIKIQYNNGDNAEGYISKTNLVVGESYPKGSEAVLYVWGKPD